jgi:hypothetical protein
LLVGGDYEDSDKQYEIMKGGTLNVDEMLAVAQSFMRGGVIENIEHVPVGGTTTPTTSTFVDLDTVMRRDEEKLSNPANFDPSVRDELNTLIPEKSESYPIPQLSQTHQTHHSHQTPNIKKTVSFGGDNNSGSSGSNNMS